LQAEPSSKKLLNPREGSVEYAHLGECNEIECGRRTGDTV